MMTEAAVRGSRGAASVLGDAYYCGLWGMPKDKKQAKRWYRRVASNRIDDINDADVESAAARVLEPDE